MAILILGVLAAYRNALRTPFVLDDGDAITENLTIRHLLRSWDVFAAKNAGATVAGRPVLNVSLAVNYAVSGERVWSYHALNILIHCLAGCALFGLVRRTLELPRLRPRWGDAALPASLAIAGLWLLHPLQTESVTYVSQRAESLAGLFYLLTLYCFARAAGALRPRKWHALAFVSCLLDVGTKEIAVTLPVIVFLYDRTFVAGSFREAWGRRRWIHLALFATWIPLAACVGATGWNRGGTAGFDVGVRPWEYWRTQFPAVAHYLKLSFWPHPLIFDYGPLWLTWREAAPSAVVVLVLVVLTGLALARWTGAGFLAAFFFVNLAPTSFVPGTNQMFVEHRMYLPLAAMIAGVVLFVYRLGGRRSLALWPVLGIIFGCMTHARNRAYRSEQALWTDTVAKAPANPRAHYTLGVIDSGLGDFRGAIREDETAVRLAAAAPHPRALPAMYNKLGYDLEQAGHMPEALASFEQALRLNPAYTRAHLNLARAFARLGRYGDAIAEFQRSLALDRDNGQAEAELADAFMQEGRAADALPHWQAALREAPNWAQGYCSLGYALFMSGRIQSAVSAYRAAVRLDPKSAPAWDGLGNALLAGGNPSGAIDACERAVRLQRSFGEAQNTLGVALARSGRPDLAIGHFEASLQLDPRQPDVEDDLGNALSALGQSTDAIRHFRAALSLDPNFAPAHRDLGQELRHAGLYVEADGELAEAARLERAQSRR